MAKARTRRTPEESRRTILDAAASLLAEGGVAAVQVRGVAARVDMTDAGITHHFGNRQGLLTALLHDGGRQIRSALNEVIESWLEEDSDLHDLVRALYALYQGGYNELAVALHSAGWRDDGSGLLDPVVEALHRLRPPGSPIDDTRYAVAALHQAIALDDIYGTEFRRSAGLSSPAAADSTTQLDWWTRQLALALDLDDGPR